MKINYLQFAKDYDFENAWKIYPSADINNDDIHNYLNTGEYKSICCEIFLVTEKGYLIVGFSSQDNDYLKFIQESISFAKDTENIEQYVQQIRKETPDLIRVGILDYWFKTGLCVLWERGKERKFSKEYVTNMLKTTPQIIRTKLNQQGLSSTFQEMITLQNIG